MTAIVGPLKRVWFSGGDGPRYYDLPANTLDLRYEACPSHHPACACREAMIAESFSEHMAENRAMHDAILAAVKGHNTYAVTPDGWPDEFARCKCQACGIARAACAGRIQHMREARENRERLAAEARRRDREWRERNCPDLDEVPF